MKRILPLSLLSVLLLLLCSCGGEHTCSFCSWHTLEAPSCTSEGREYRSCTCGNTESRPVAMLPHELITVDEKPVACTESGYAAFEYCADCSYTTFAGELPPAHSIVTVDAKAPTCTDVGYEAYEYCDRCENYNTYSEISATGHRFSTPKCENCTATLTEVTIPEDTVTLTDNITAAYYVTDSGLSLLTLSGTGAIPDFDTSPFADLAPTHLYIGEGITSIGKKAFSGMSTLVSVTIGTSVAHIGDGAFADCYRITEVINESVLSISYDTSYGEIGRFASIITTDTATRVKFIGDFVFYVHNGNYTLVSYLGTDEHITLPVLDEVDAYVVRDCAFYDLDFLKTVEIGSHVIYVAPYAFEGCDNLK